MREIMLLVLVCATPVYGQESTKDFRTGAGCGPQNTQYDVTLSAPDKEVIAPSSGKARVYVIEIVGTSDAGVTRVGVDGKWMGANTGNGYLSFEVDPGNYNICADSQTTRRTGGAMVMRAKQGRTYYFVEGFLIEPLDFNLKEVDEAEGQWLLSISKKSVWTQKK